jgi:threonine dehydrogenase-like Zn-dependent dehydrogenase
MKGLTLEGKGIVAWRDRPVPKAGPRDAILRPLAVSPCTTDAHLVENFPFPKMKGVILGHEAVGEIVEVGAEVKVFRIGDHVLVSSVTPEWDAIEVQDNLAKFSNGMGYLFTQSKDGVFAEYFHVNHADQNLALLPAGITPLQAVMCADMLPTACAGAEAADIRFGDSVVVIGIGPVGLLSVAAAKLRGAGQITAIGTRKSCVDAAYKYGANCVLSYKDDGWDQKAVEVNGHPYDVAIVAGGKSSSIGMALGMVKMGGTVSNVAGFIEESTILPNDKWFLGTSDKTIKGTMVPGGRRYMERMLNLVFHERVDVIPLASHVLHGLDAIEEAVSLMAKKPDDLIKPVVLLE